MLSTVSPQKENPRLLIGGFRSFYGLTITTKLITSAYRAAYKWSTDIRPIRHSPRPLQETCLARFSPPICGRTRRKFIVHENFWHCKEIFSVRLAKNLASWYISSVKLRNLQHWWHGIAAKKEPRLRHRGSFGTSSFYRLTITTWLSSPFEVLIQPFADDVYRNAGCNGNE